MAFGITDILPLTLCQSWVTFIIHIIIYLSFRCQVMSVWSVFAFVLIVIHFFFFFTLGGGPLHPQVQGCRRHEQFRRLRRGAASNLVHGKVRKGVLGVLDVVVIDDEDEGHISSSSTVPQQLAHHTTHHPLITEFA